MPNKKIVTTYPEGEMGIRNWTRRAQQSGQPELVPYLEDRGRDLNGARMIVIHISGIETPGEQIRDLPPQKRYIKYRRCATCRELVKELDQSK